MSEALKRKIGYLPEERGLYQKMTVGEQLLFLAQLKNVEADTARRRIGDWMAPLELADWKDKKVEELSKGMQQKVQFIATVVHEPDLIILDEPFTGLDPINANLLKDIIIELKNRNKTVLFSTHRMEQVEMLCDNICLINKGRNILSGHLKEIKQRYGRNTIHLEYQGNLDFLKGSHQVQKIDDYGNYAEIQLQDGAQTQEVMKEVVSRVQVYKLELMTPSLNEIFIQEVGKSHE